MMRLLQALNFVLTFYRSHCLKYLQSQHRHSSLAKSLRLCYFVLYNFSASAVNFSVLFQWTFLLVFTFFAILSIHQILEQRLICPFSPPQTFLYISPQLQLCTVVIYLHGSLILSIQNGEKNVERQIGNKGTSNQWIVSIYCTGWIYHTVDHLPILIWCKMWKHIHWVIEPNVPVCPANCAYITPLVLELSFELSHLPKGEQTHTSWTYALT